MRESPSWAPSGPERDMVRPLLHEAERSGGKHEEPRGLDGTEGWRASGGWGHLCLELQDEQVFSRRRYWLEQDALVSTALGTGETLGHSRSGRAELEPGDSLNTGQDRAVKAGAESHRAH